MAWVDEALKQRRLAEPGAVLREQGPDVPTGVQVRVAGNTDRV